MDSWPNPMETIDTVLIYLHAGLGGVALLAGLVALISRKGSRPHKLAGKVFAWGMLASVAVALVVSVMPGHANPILFGIGLFSGYFIISGYRALGYRKMNPNLLPDRILALGLVMTSLAMIWYPIVFHGSINIVLTIFGAVGLLFGIRDWRLTRSPKALSENWLVFHLGKMGGGYIAAWTAFLVVNEVLPGIASWLAPTILGTLLIVWWSRKVRKGFRPNPL